MPDESCRHCGGKLVDFSQCSECKQTIRMMCRNCNSLTMEQFHSECIWGTLQLNNYRITNTGNFYYFIPA
jgi:hypothetical protein